LEINNYEDQGQRNARTLIGLRGDLAVTVVRLSLQE